MKLTNKAWSYIYSSYLCIRFPFLYPKNRFTGKHYNNWKILEKIKTLKSKYKYGLEILDKPNDEGRLVIVQEAKWSLIDKIKLFILNTVHKFLEILHCVPRYTELDSLEKGWRKAFGVQLCKEIKQSLKTPEGMAPFAIIQIKEKWGELRLYYNGGTLETSRVIYKYEEISRNTCINCGKCATVQTNGYILPLCDDCCKGEKCSYTDLGLIGFYGYKGNINNRSNWDQLKEEYNEEDIL